MPNEIICYEHPLNECIRICLRLEHLFNYFQQYIRSASDINSRFALMTLIEILNVIDRPDLKSRLTQTLTQNATTLSQLQILPQIDQSQLNQILAQLDPLINQLHSTHTKIAESLRNNDFLNSVRMQLHNPGGVCDFALPVFALWLKQPLELRLAQLSVWYQEFSLLEDITTIILKLTRDSTVPEQIVALDGFYQRTLNPALPCQMVRIQLPIKANVYPEVSVGKHRMSIHFLQTHYETGKRLTQRHQDIEFYLSCCRI